MYAPIRDPAQAPDLVRQKVSQVKKFLAVLGLVSLAACGAIYNSSDVPTNDPNVLIVAMDSGTVSSANRSKYRPKQLPDVFFQNAGGARGMRGLGVTPEPSLDRQQRPGQMTTRIPPDVPNRPYRIGVGDVLLLATKSGGSTVAELSGLLAAQSRRQGYTVQDDGAIAIPDVGRVVVAEKALEGAEATLFESLVRNQIDPSFSLEIAEFNSKRVAVGGAVKNPTVVPVRLSPLNLAEAISAAGGIATTDLDYAAIRLYRDGALYQIPMTEYRRRAELQKLRLAAGDSIFVDTEYDLDRAQAYFREQITLAQYRQTARVQALAELQAEVTLRRAVLAEERSNFESRVALDGVDRDFAYLAGEVNTPARFALPFENHATLADALYDKGGFSAASGDPAQIYVMRATPTASNPALVTAFHLGARNAAKIGLATKMQLRPNDVIFVAEQQVTRWGRVINQLSPTLLVAGAAAVTN